MIKPDNGFLEQLKKLCEDHGALLIFDEVVSGFRFSLGGAQEMVGVTPHLSAFGKAMANGFSVSALVGLREIMQLGGFDHEEERIFLLSSTHGGENPFSICGEGNYSGNTKTQYYPAFLEYW